MWHLDIYALITRAHGRISDTESSQLLFNYSIITVLWSRTFAKTVKISAMPPLLILKQHKEHICHRFQLHFKTYRYLESYDLAVISNKTLRKVACKLSHNSRCWQWAGILRSFLLAGRQERNICSNKNLQVPYHSLPPFKVQYFPSSLSTACVRIDYERYMLY